jgi:AmpE protein
MSAVLIAVVLALVLGHAAPQLAQVRQYGWFREWFKSLGAKFSASGFHGSRYGILLSLGLPLLLVGLVQWAFDDHLYGLPGFAFAAIVFFYCWGPRDLDLDVDAVVEATDSDHRRLAARALLGPDREVALDAPTLVEGVFAGALERWFGVLLWFVVLGPVGAMLYRLTQLGATRDLANELPLEHGDSYRRLKLILDWPAAQLMVLGLALAANFDVVVAAWRRWHAERNVGWFNLDTGFLGAAARVSVDCELAEDLDESYAPDTATAGTPAPAMPALKDAMSLAWRVLLMWLVVLAIFVLAGFVN